MIFAVVVGAGRLFEYLDSRSRSDGEENPFRKRKKPKRHGERGEPEI